MRLITRDKTYYQSLIRLAIPVALQSLITFLVTFADNLMVNSLGDAAVSGVYMGSQIQTLIQMFTSGIGGAILIISAQYWGKQDTKHIRCIVAIGLRISIVVGLAFTVIGLIFPKQIIHIFTPDTDVIREGAIYFRWVCLSYVFFCVTQALISAMRSVEVTRIGMWVSLASLFVNISLNYVLIFGKLGFPAMGVQGAAIATLLTRVTEAAVILLYVCLYDKRLSFRLSHLFLHDSGLAHDFIKYGLPLVAGEIVWSVNMMCNSKILGGYGASVITAASVVNTLNTLAFITISGLSSAVGIITGKTIGAGKTELMKEYAYTTQILFLGVGLFSGALVALIAKPFIGLYTGISADAAHQSLMFARVMAVTIIGTGYQMPCLFGLVKSGGDIHFVFRNDTIFVFLVVLPSAIIAAWLGAPAWVTFACLKCDQILKCFVAVVKINRFNWMKNLTRA
ncbi:MAG: MATE family efflux transporter [Lachnospiraceae bacterium]|jgi:putative MATE family efflux protein|nr:MATE family efflux transporter [Lachnospiraceae bacterium]MCX4315793.1 MATE family efflux transporter [Lachnospiraceae bacterium]